MKKCLLFISLLVYFLPTVSGNGNASFHKSVSLTVETNGYTLLSSEYPHSEFVFNSHTVFANSGYRQQILPGFISATAFSERPFLSKEVPSADSKSHISSKQYLFHIYPSHNFW